MVILAAVPLAACQLPIEPSRSGIEPPARFVSAGPVRAAARMDPSWWRSFGSPELDRLMAAAMAGNQDVTAATARLRQADAQLRIVSAQLLPVVDASASAARSRSTNPGNLNAAGNAARRYGGSVAASYEIDFWGRLRAQERAAEDSVTASIFSVGTVMLSTQAAVAATLFDLFGAREELRVQQDNLALAERTLEILRQRFAVGTATGLDVAQQETSVAQQRAAVPPLQRRVEADTFALATLAGMRPEEIAVAADPLTGLRVPVVASGLPSELLARRPDVRVAEASLAAADADVTAARGALFPTIVLTGEGGVQSAALDALLRPGSTFYNLALGLSRPIFDGGSLRAQLEQARGRQEELLAAYRQAILAALQDAETSLSALRRNAELLRLSRAREEAARRAYAIADAQFRAGTIDLLTLLITQTALFNARLAVVQAQTSHLQSASGLFAALGGGWTPDMVRPAPAPRPSEAR